MELYSDESGFPDREIQTVCFLRWEKKSLDLLRISILKYIQDNKITDLKRSKIRAKKSLLQATLDICTLIETWKKKSQWWILVFAWNDVVYLYNQWMNLFQEKCNTKNQLISFFPDKNLTLQWHSDKHQFINDNRFLSIMPVTLRHEPIWVIPDLFAGMVREAMQRPELFSTAPHLISHKPDKYKVMARQQWSSLLSFFQFYQV
jgi:hypothetical protein